MKFLKRWLQSLFFHSTGEFLCDRCRLDYPSACRRPERPNAKTCPDYKRK